MESNLNNSSIVVIFLLSFDLFKEYDATCLAKDYQGRSVKILIDQGSEDNFLKQNQLLPQNIVDAVHSNKAIDIEMRYQNVSLFQLILTYTFFGV